MKDQINTIREALEQAKQNTTHGQIAWNCKEALAALAQIEAAVGEPVAFVTDADVACFGKGAQGEIAALLHRQGKWCHPLFTGTPVAQQPHVPEADCGNIDWKHPKIQALISADARNRIVIDLIWQILKDPEGDFSAMDMEYWDSIHDAVQAAVAKAQQPQAEAVPPSSLLDPGTVVSFAVDRWLAEVANRPLVNKNRRTLDDTWRQVIRRFGGDPDALLGPSHDELVARAQPQQAEGVPPDVVRDAERWRTFLATRPANTHAVINDAIDAAMAKGEKS